MKQTELVIVGGGILGAGVAQAAIAGRFKVILLESNSVGSATSCNSSKLIHGGLRYLESAQLGLVRDSLKERKKLFDIANHLVKPINFYIPIYQKSKRSGWVITLGLFLYYVLSGFSKWGRFKIIPKKHWGKIKGIKKSGLKMILQYWDGQTDDRKLCEEVAQSARSLGADIIENAKCTSIIKKDEGYTVRYLSNNELLEIECSAVINTTGPWASQLLEKVEPNIEPPSIDWVQGTHVLLDIPVADGIIYLESCFDERVIFVMPWYGKKR